MFGANIVVLQIKLTQTSHTSVAHVLAGSLGISSLLMAHVSASLPSMHET